MNKLTLRTEVKERKVLMVAQIFLSCSFVFFFPSFFWAKIKEQPFFRGPGQSSPPLFSFSGNNNTKDRTHHSFLPPYFSLCPFLGVKGAGGFLRFFFIFQSLLTSSLAVIHHAKRKSKMEPRTLSTHETKHKRTQTLVPQDTRIDFTIDIQTLGDLTNANIPCNSKIHQVPWRR